MKCFCPVNGLYCKNPEYARLLPPREKGQSHERKVPLPPQLRVFTGPQYYFRGFLHRTLRASIAP